jgi:hypothetical protein
MMQRQEDERCGSVSAVSLRQGRRLSHSGPMCRPGLECLGEKGPLSKRDSASFRPEAALVLQSHLKCLADSLPVALHL